MKNSAAVKLKQFIASAGAGYIKEQSGGDVEIGES